MKKKGTYDNSRLLALRKALGYTHDQMGSAAGMSRSNYTNVELGKQPLLPRHKQTLIHSLNLNEAWFDDVNAPMFAQTSALSATMGAVANEPDAIYIRSASCVDKALSDISEYYRETFGGMNVEQKMSGYFIVGFIREALSIKKI